jgi:epoxyqueuosine reductase
MMNLDDLVRQIKSWAAELGFQDIAITDGNLKDYSGYLEQWLENNYHGQMHYMTQNHEKRLHPELLHPDTCRVISARMDYLPDSARPMEILRQTDKAYVARYALGRDYHKLMRKRLAKLAEKINAEISPDGQKANYRAFADSAPVLEKALAEKAGLGWIGKNTLLLTRDSGSWFFLGEIFTNIPLPLSNVEGVAANHCGACKACMKICPTGALVGPNQLDARKCISYLTIENPGGIPTQLRKKMGNRIFGCDDCQIICPWNRYAQHTQETDFHPRHQLDNEDLLALFLWDEETFLKNTEGSAIRRIKFWQWQRNIAVGLGNAPYSSKAIAALRARLTAIEEVSEANANTEILREHIQWAITQLIEKNAPDKPVTQQSIP